MYPFLFIVGTGSNEKGDGCAVDKCSSLLALALGSGFDPHLAHCKITLIQSYIGSLSCVLNEGSSHDHNNMIRISAFLSILLCTFLLVRQRFIVIVCVICTQYKCTMRYVGTHTMNWDGCCNISRNAIQKDF